MTRGYASGTLISGPQRGSLIWTVSAMQNKRKWLIKRGGHLLGRSFRPLRGSVICTGTLQDTGHLLGGGVYKESSILIHLFYVFVRNPTNGLQWLPEGNWPLGPGRGVHHDLHPLPQRHWPFWQPKPVCKVLLPPYNFVSIRMAYSPKLYKWITIAQSRWLSTNPISTPTSRQLPLSTRSSVFWMKFICGRFVDSLLSMPYFSLQLALPLLITQVLLFLRSIFPHDGPLGTGFFPPLKTAH